MSELSIEESEAIIEAAARGHVSSEHGAVGEVLTSLHSPGAADALAPELAVAASGVTGRIARRTAVAATVAVLGLAGVAAAATGAGTLLDSPDPGFADTADAAVEFDEPDLDEDEDASAGVEDEGDDVELPQHLAPVDDDADQSVREIEGVDPSDGLDDDELELACDGAENHGHYVSLVARDKITETDGTHGDRVSEAAGSDCGKDGEASDEDADSTDEESDDGEASDDADDDDDDDDDDKRGKGHEKSKGKGHSQGNGHGHGHDRD